MLISLCRLTRDERGVSAIEFAIIAPVLIALYLGMAEACQAYMAQKRMGHATAMVADLTAQESTVTPTAVNQFFAIGGLIMKPYSAASLNLRVSSVTRDANGKDTVDWSVGHGMVVLGKGSAFPIPAGVIENGQSIVVSEAAYDYDSPVDYVMPGITRFNHIYYLRPRTSEKTECPTCPIS